MVYVNQDVIEHICGNDGEDEIEDHVWGGVHDPNNNPSNIQRFYEDSCIFVTGGSGFIGMALVEKLLRSCPGINKLFLLMRSRKGKSVEERATEMFRDPLFVPLLVKCPTILEKVKLIPGDIEEPNLGISASDAETLKREVNIVFHVAATVRFDEHLRTAYRLNVLTVKDIIALTKSMTNLKALVHVSTAFCPTQHGVRRIWEKFYPIPYSGEEIEALLKTNDDYTIACLLRQFLGKTPDTNILTKAMGEDLMRQEIGNLPIAIYRPGIVSQAYDEPLHGWINTVQGGSAIFLGIGLGLLRVVFTPEKKIAELIPVDKCASALAVLPWHIHNSRHENYKIIPIFNHLTDTTTYKEALDVVLIATKEKKLSSKNQVWVIRTDFEANKFMFEMKSFFYHVVPLPLFILAEKLQNQPPRLLKIYQKMFHLTNILSSFSLNNLEFEAKNIQHMWFCMSEQDQYLFRFDLKSINWFNYFWQVVQSYGFYLMKENQGNWNDLMQARVAMKRMLALDRCLRLVIKGTMLFVTYKIAASLLNTFTHFLEYQINRSLF